MYEYVSAVLVLLVIVIIYFVWQNKKHLYNSMMTGFWMGDETFLNQSELESMALYVGEDLGGTFSELRRAYLIMTTAGAVIVQKIIYMGLSGSAGIFGSTVSKTLTLRDDAEGNIETGKPEAGLDEATTVSIGKVMTDEPLACDINLSVGVMSWSNEEKVYARFFRNFQDDVQGIDSNGKDIKDNTTSTGV